jgi:hypothetical protein
MRVETMDEALDHPYGYLDEGEVVVEVGVSKDVEAVDCHEIVQRYKVEVGKKKLQKLAGKKPAKAEKKPAKKVPAKSTSVKSTSAKSTSAKKPRRGPRT